MKRWGTGIALVCGVVLALAVEPASADVLNGYCCECAGCPVASTVECISVTAEGRSGASDCAKTCTSNLHCSSSLFVEGACSEHLIDCDPQVFHRAPAISHASLVAVFLMLAAWGMYRVRRRRLL